VIGDPVTDGFRDMVGIESSTQGDLLGERVPYRSSQPLTLRTLESLLDQQREALTQVLSGPLAKTFSDPLTKRIHHGAAHRG